MSESEAHNSMTAAKMYALTLAIKEGMPQEVNRADILAQIRRVHYDASIRNGFTASEAIVLCMNTDIN